MEQCRAELDRRRHRLAHPDGPQPQTRHTGNPPAPWVGATEGSNGSLDVGWLEPALAGHFVKYYLRYRQEIYVPWTDGPQNITSTFGKITGLRAGTTYEVQVLASNNNGDSDWSPSGTGRTDSGAPYPAPPPT